MVESSDASQRAEEIFADFLARRERGEEARFEELLERHPREAAQLERDHEDWLALRAVLGDFGAGGSAGDVLPASAALAADDAARYRIVDEVGRGGMGLVLEAWDRKLERFVGLKRMRPTERAASERRERRFLAEAKLTAQLEHPGIVAVHDLGLDGSGAPYFTMQLVRGRDLGEVLALARHERDGWTRTRVLGEMLKVCQTVAYAHARGVVHRDLKPANIRVGSFGEVYVIDWGLARRSEGSSDDGEQGAGGNETESTVAPELTREGDVLGTPAYMPPEQAAGNRDAVGTASDVYALGAILYELLARSAPYADERSSSRVLLERILAGPPEPLARAAPDAPEELATICNKAMARDPAQRYASVQLLAQDLQAYLEGRVVAAHASGPWIEAKKWIQRNRALATSLALAATFLVVGAAVSLGLYWRAERRADEVLSLSAIQDLRSLERRADALWPAVPELRPEFERWLADADELIRSRPRYAVQLAALRTKASSGDGSPQSPWTFDDRGDRWWHAQLESLVQALGDLADPARGLARGVGSPFGWGVARRLEFASEVERATVSGDVARARWRDAAEAIAHSPRYAGLVLAPQLGLVPLGPDPASGLWEFAHLQTGEPAQRDARTGAIVLAGSSGLVLVLIPGVRFAMGAQASDPSRADFESAANPDESPVREVELAPYFLSKFEMTQAQWLRAAGDNPSDYSAGATIVEHHVSDLHPVEQVSWTRARAVLRRLALELPTEAQWEYAARAGTRTPWWTGSDASSLEGAANLADAYSERMGAPSGYGYESWEDGWLIHAPVGSFRASPFGLHDVHGNVWEWCLDANAPYSIEPRPGDGLRDPPGVRNRIYRGGSFNYRASSARSALRDNAPPELTSSWVGLRPARAVDRPR